MTRRGRENTIAGTVGVLVAVSGMSVARPALADNQFATEFFVGTSVSFKTPLKIEQAGQPDIDFSARYDTKPFKLPIYWMFRFDRLREGSRWELQLTHQKLFLENNPPEVEHFEITHGYNLPTVNRAFAAEHFAWRVGAGAVIAHSESEGSSV